MCNNVAPACVVKNETNNKSNTMERRTALAAAMLAMVFLTLASCSGNDGYATKSMTEQQKKDFGNAVKGNYKGKCIVFFIDANSQYVPDENGKNAKTGEEKVLEDMELSVSNYDSRLLTLHKFPASIVSGIVDADPALKEAIASLPDVDLTANYAVMYGSDLESYDFYLTPNPISFTTEYGGKKHHIRITFESLGRVYVFSPKDLEKPNAFATQDLVTFSAAAIYDGERLVQTFDTYYGNGMEIAFKLDKG